MPNPNVYIPQQLTDLARKYPTIAVILRYIIANEINPGILPPDQLLPRTLEIFKYQLDIAPLSTPLEVRPALPQATVPYAVEIPNKIPAKDRLPSAGKKYLDALHEIELRIQTDNIPIRIPRPSIATTQQVELRVVKGDKFAGTVERTLRSPEISRVLESLEVVKKPTSADNMVTRWTNSENVLDENKLIVRPVSPNLPQVAAKPIIDQNNTVMARRNRVEDTLSNQVNLTVLTEELSKVMYENISAVHTSLSEIEAGNLAQYLAEKYSVRYGQIIWNNAQLTGIESARRSLPEYFRLHNPGQEVLMDISNYNSHQYFTHGKMIPADVSKAVARTVSNTLQQDVSTSQIEVFRITLGREKTERGGPRVIIESIGDRETAGRQSLRQAEAVVVPHVAGFERFESGFSRKLRDTLRSTATAARGKSPEELRNYIIKERNALGFAMYATKVFKDFNENPLGTIISTPGLASLALTHFPIVTTAPLLAVGAIANTLLDDRARYEAQKEMKKYSPHGFEEQMLIYTPQLLQQRTNQIFAQLLIDPERVWRYGYKAWDDVVLGNLIRVIERGERTRILTNPTTYIPNWRQRAALRLSQYLRKRRKNSEETGPIKLIVGGALGSVVGGMLVEGSIAATKWIGKFTRLTSLVQKIPGIENLGTHLKSIGTAWSEGKGTLGFLGKVQRSFVPSVFKAISGAGVGYVVTMLTGNPLLGIGTGLFTSAIGPEGPLLGSAMFLATGNPAFAIGTGVGISAFDLIKNFSKEGRLLEGFFKTRSGLATTMDIFPLKGAVVSAILFALGITNPAILIGLPAAELIAKSARHLYNNGLGEWFAKYSKFGRGLMDLGFGAYELDTAGGIKNLLGILGEDFSRLLSGDISLLKFLSNNMGRILGLIGIYTGVGGILSLFIAGNVPLLLTLAVGSLLIVADSLLQLGGLSLWKVLFKPWVDPLWGWIKHNVFEHGAERLAGVITGAMGILNLVESLIKGDVQGVVMATVSVFAGGALIIGIANMAPLAVFTPIAEAVGTPATNLYLKEIDKSFDYESFKSDTTHTQLKYTLSYGTIFVPDPDDPSKNAVKMTVVEEDEYEDKPYKEDLDLGKTVISPFVIKSNTGSPLYMNTPVAEVASPGTQSKQITIALAKPLEELIGPGEELCNTYTVTATIEMADSALPKITESLADIVCINSEGEVIGLDHLPLDPSNDLYSSEYTIRNYNLITSCFYIRRIKENYYDRHSGLDIQSVKGAPVYAMGTGNIIETVRSDTGLGNHIKVKYSDVKIIDGRTITAVAYYGHLDNFLDGNNNPIYAGQQVKGGDIIGHVDNSGYSEGNHLHLEMRTENESEAFNPCSLDGLNLCGIGPYFYSSLFEDPANFRCPTRYDGIGL